MQIYVDDIIFGGTKENLVKDFVQTMTREVEMSMIGELNYFMGLQIKQMEEEILSRKALMQSCYKVWHAHVQGIKDPYEHYI